MARNQPAQGALTVAQAQRIATLPVRGLEVARVAWANHDSPWFFCNRTDDPATAGRFDLERPRGTCYLAREPIGALFERLCDPEDLDRVISYPLLERLSVWTGTLQIDGDIADATHPGSRITTELRTMTPYEVPWSIADVLAKIGRAGLQWVLRFHPSGKRGVALFGPASSPADLPDRTDWPPLATRRPATRWVDELDGPFEIVDVPSLFQLRRATDP